MSTGLMVWYRELARRIHRRRRRMQPRRMRGGTTNGSEVETTTCSSYQTDTDEYAERYHTTPLLLELNQYHQDLLLVFPEDGSSTSDDDSATDGAVIAGTSSRPDLGSSSAHYQHRVDAVWLRPLVLDHDDNNDANGNDTDTVAAVAAMPTSQMPHHRIGAQQQHPEAEVPVPRCVPRSKKNAVSPPRVQFRLPLHLQQETSTAGAVASHPREVTTTTWAGLSPWWEGQGSTSSRYDGD